MLKKSTRNLIRGLRLDKTGFPTYSKKGSTERKRAARIMNSRVAKDAIRKRYRD